jgi:hypothetical protein
MDASVVNARLEEVIIRLDGTIRELKEEVGDLRSDINGIKDKVTLSKGLVIGVLLAVGCAIWGFVDVFKAVFGKVVG